MKETEAIQELEYDLSRAKTPEEKYNLIMKFAEAMAQQVPTGGIVPIEFGKWISIKEDTIERSDKNFLNHLKVWHFRISHSK